MSWELYARIRVMSKPIAQPRTRTTAVKVTQISKVTGLPEDVWKGRAYDPGSSRGWKELVMLSAAPYAGRQVEGPIGLKITFILPRPKSRRADLYVTTKPDFDNLTKSTADALTECGVWRDDSQVVKFSMEKLYEGPCSIGAYIEIYTWGKEQGE